MRGSVGGVSKGAHFVGVGAEEQQVEGDGGDEVDDEPPAQVVHGDLGGVWFYLIRGAHVSRPEVYQDIDYESHIDWK